MPGLPADLAALDRILREVPRLYLAETTSESTYYSSLRALFQQLLTQRGLPFEVRVATKEPREGGGRDLPDLALYDKGDYAAVLVEVKLPHDDLQEVAFSTERTNQVGRYLAQTGVVLVTNVRSVGLLACRAGYERSPATPVPAEDRELLERVDLWASEEALRRADPVGDEQHRALADLLERAATEFAPIADPSTLARILARQARRAKVALPKHFDAVAPLLEDYGDALGLTFDDEEGLRFFRSSLIQTAYYSLFAGWALWWRANDGAPFNLDSVERYLRIPFLGQLFYEFRHPARLKELGLAPHLARATETLGRVDTATFFARFRLPHVEEEDGAASALTYFYEPFLEAFDPDLRKELGVWYTPPEIVRYQVGKIERLLKEELDCHRGFADDRVVVLDPCCGTGAYLLEIIRCVARELKARGEQELLGPLLREAITSRIIGFEILTAPFVISQLQLYLALAELGTPPKQDERPAVFLTNALTGWTDAEQVKLNFPELQEERDAAARVKRGARIIVMLGNPPYNRFAGAAMAEEADLVDHYKGIRRVPKHDRRGAEVLGTDGKPILVQDGESLLHSRWGVRKHLLDDLYIRFFRLAEKRIGEEAEYGVVSFISNSSYLTGRSHPLMRESLLKNFHAAWIDNTNGDKYRTGKVIPEGLPGAGTSDQSVFSTQQDPRGIQVGTCISTFLKRRETSTPPQQTPVHCRDFWGRADAKRRALLEALEAESWSTQRLAEAAARPEGPREYEAFQATEAEQWRFCSSGASLGYEEWPSLDELFPVQFQGVNPNRGLTGSIVDEDRNALIERMQVYFSAERFDEVERAAPELMKKRASYNPRTTWKELRGKTQFSDELVASYLLFPLDLRWIYYQPSSNLLNRERPEFRENLRNNEFLVAVPQARRVSETRPLAARTLVDLHAHDRGSVCIPREAASGGLLSERSANLAGAAWQMLRRHFNVAGELTDPGARELVGKLFRCVLAILHSPTFESDHGDAMRHDWARVPIPREHGSFDRLAALGDRVWKLLDAEEDIDAAVEEIIGAQRLQHLGVFRTSPSGDPDLRLTVSYFGAAKGKWVERPFEYREEPFAEWGETTGDLWINESTYFCNVPERVWRHELGGYPVIKKWLGYRQANRRGGRPLTLDEVQHLRSMIWRLAALLALGPALDQAYEDVAASALTSADLGLAG